MYGIDAGMGGKMRSIATMKAKSKKKKPSKIGEMLDRKEMEQAPRRPFLEKAKPTKMIYTKEMRKAMPPRMRKLKDK
jgi:hypothetical protein